MKMKLCKCKKCNVYTLEETCKQCNVTTSSSHPAKYSKEDKYAIYRRKERYPDFP
ncbi:MAG: nucleolar RNA-binding Nop10p family protein [Candidatus Micrarchaeota archaeon]|nr:nucleolar RNA-binding Nop10p family protein [Candidatus Micrarchaeota archaeon]